jgi:hypothetical protein
VTRRRRRTPVRQDARNAAIVFLIFVVLPAIVSCCNSSP